MQFLMISQVSSGILLFPCGLSHHWLSSHQCLECCSAVEVQTPFARRRGLKLGSMEAMSGRTVSNYLETGDRIARFFTSRITNLQRVKIKEEKAASQTSKSRFFFASQCHAMWICEEISWSLLAIIKVK